MTKLAPNLLSAILALIMAHQSASASTRIRFGDLYVGETYQAGIGMRPDLKLSDKIQGLNGQIVEILGFMDGVLPRDGKHFMLIKEPTFLCPFHAVSFDWSGFVPIFLKGSTDYMDGPMRVVGRLDVGPKTDEMGLLSYVRIYDAKVQRAQ
jgi:hypothetical protein